MMSMLTLTLTPKEAVLLAGGVLLLLNKGIKTDDGTQDRFTQVLGLSLLNRLSDYDFEDEEIQDMLRAAVDSGTNIAGEEVICFESLDGIPQTDAEKCM
jgi:hypothetical protein